MATPDRQILLVEDNPGDIKLIEIALAEYKFPGSITKARDAGEALDYLKARINQSGASLPDLILLDWNLPNTAGDGFLTAVKAEPALRHIPVVVFTSSESEFDAHRAAELGAAAYISKPPDLDSYMSAVRHVVRQWCPLA